MTKQTPEAAVPVQTPRYQHILDHITEFCSQNDKDLAGTGACAALRAMLPFWQSHLQDGCDAAIIAKDLRDVRDLIEELLGEITLFTQALPVAVAKDEKGSNTASVVIGAFYELPDGRIVRTYGWSGITRIVSYSFDDDDGPQRILVDETVDWKERKDLRDYPNARNPRLPYAFDLHYDIQYMSDLRQELKGHPHELELRKLMAKHGITI